MVGLWKKNQCKELAHRIFEQKSFADAVSLNGCVERLLESTNDAEVLLTINFMNVLIVEMFY